MYERLECQEYPLAQECVLLSLVPLHVQRQVIRAGEGPVTHLAAEWLVSCMLAVVPGQLIRAGKLPAAILPGTLVWLLPCKHHTC